MSFRAICPGQRVSQAIVAVYLPHTPQLLITTSRSSTVPLPLERFGGGMSPEQLGIQGPVASTFTPVFVFETAAAVLP
jgi:hypothetical protein